MERELINPEQITNLSAQRPYKCIILPGVYMYMLTSVPPNQIHSYATV